MRSAGGTTRAPSPTRGSGTARPAAEGGTAIRPRENESCNDELEHAHRHTWSNCLFLLFLFQATARWLVCVDLSQGGERVRLPPSITRCSVPPARPALRWQ